ncbi:unnamed protein product [Dovyalis caffra]|uniref:Uncharacterized protein n=1 Tax=Dovyalis caffra TaxID=77055 RepID=A0AAV1QVL4_9ROSI|nr:unnamed protein product [Dovyalis caffra]
MELARHLMEWILYPQMNLSPFLHKPRQLRALGFPVDEGSRPQALFPLRAWRGQEEDELLGTAPRKGRKTDPGHPAISLASVLHPSKPLHYRNLLVKCSTASSLSPSTSGVGSAYEVFLNQSLFPLPPTTATIGILELTISSLPDRCR